MRQDKALQVLFEDRLVGMLALTADHKAAFEYTEVGWKKAFRSIHFHFLCKAVYLFRQEITLKVCLVCSQTVCRMPGESFC